MPTPTLRWPALAGSLALLLAIAAHADGPKDNVVAAVRPIPPAGIEVPADSRAAIAKAVAELRARIAKLRETGDAKTLALLPDLEIYAKAAADALEFNEFFNKSEFPEALSQLAEGAQRATALEQGQAPWTTATGLVVRGYVSKLDGSIQPYGLVVPKSYDPSKPSRLDLWFHGRGETLSELSFIAQRRKQVGEFAPANAIVLHLYGRYCNANKFAGEIDAIEAIDSVKQRYKVDEERVLVRGFSMGGAAAWHFAVHYPDRWAAANPGAGFSETPEFLRIFQDQKVTPTWFEKKLWHLYDCTDWAGNLRHCPTVAYSGEIDKQKQAADVMSVAMDKEGLRLVHIIGPKTGHKYEPGAKKLVEEAVDKLAEQGRNRMPNPLQFTTYTLRYNRMHWVVVDGLEQHWEQARVEAEFKTAPGSVAVKTRNVSALTLDMDANLCPFPAQGSVAISIDGTKLSGPAPTAERSWRISLRKEAGAWKLASAAPTPGLVKRHGLQGPIDDAFMDAFLIVKPTGQAEHEAVGKWALSECDRAIREWRRHFRGQPRVKLDTEVTQADVANFNLVLFGDPKSNGMLSKIAGQLPLSWTPRSIDVAGKSHPAATHALIAAYPNPLNPKRYVVLNSGFTYREFAYLNNARQVPMLPDWAVVDVSVPPDSVWPGKIVDANFFNEQWK